MESYELSGRRFIIHDYDRKAPFSSFLPGLAGATGIPIWSFYTNRGQAICSFGIHHKGNAMMEFSPANTGYENAQLRGFRTFLRVDGKLYQPFLRPEDAVVRTMEVEQNVLSILEERSGLRMQVRYFVLPEENIGALVRMVEVTNTADNTVNIELLDGMPQIIPYGITNGQYKEMSNLFKSWTDIVNIENNIPIYKMRASSDDSAEVREITGGYYYYAVCDGALLPIIYDKVPIFDYEQSLMSPLTFEQGGLERVLRTTQCFYNKVPCAFVPVARRLAPGESICLTAYAGFTASEKLVNDKARACCAPGFASAKLSLARKICDDLTADVKTESADKKLDEYVRQCYLDNFLRGGYPVAFGTGEKKKIVHLFSRKHGDPERDYNFFSIAGEYYSQGNGNYRDVCQNRRLDCFLHPQVESFNVRSFYSLIQMDGYNPLEIRPCTFTIDAEAATELVKKYVSGDVEPLMQVLGRNFTPGEITSTIAAHNLNAHDEEMLVSEILCSAQQHLEAGFGEGYWSDHWDYNLDLVEDYLSVYPDRRKQLLYEDKSYPYYESVAVVRPRSETYVLSNGHVRQYGAIRQSEKKLAHEGFNPQKTNWLKDRNGCVVHTNLFEKMLTLAVNKFALLDSEGLGIEMEGGKPGWNDAMNGLPGLLGSSMPETLELRRLVRFLAKELQQRNPAEQESVFAELNTFMQSLFAALCNLGEGFDYWDTACTLRENFRASIEDGISGESDTITIGQLQQIFAAFSKKLETSVARAMEIGGGIMPTFFTYEAVDYTLRGNMTPYGLPGVKIKSLKRCDLPYFLEGPARYLASCEEQDRSEALKMVTLLKESEVYDKKLKMYKTSAPIEKESMEIGRVRAFTPGWLERESIFLHMEYKYFCGLLHAGLYDEFYEAMEPAIIPHLSPEMYGRSILENSSFLASSANPDPSVHGRGFVGRLSGSTVEMLSMWKGMLLGTGGFHCENDVLQFTFGPVLKGNLFDEHNELKFTLFGKTKVVYENSDRIDTYRGEISEMIVDACAVHGDTLFGELAEQLRSGTIREIRVRIHG